jgi:hypothetical protein
MLKSLAVAVALLAAAMLAVVVLAHPFSNSTSTADLARAQCGGRQAKPVCVRLIGAKLRDHSLYHIAKAPAPRQ